MRQYQYWEMNSEAATRFWAAYASLGRLYKWLLVVHIRFACWRHNRWFTEHPPLVHRGIEII